MRNVHKEKKRRTRSRAHSRTFDGLHELNRHHHDGVRLELRVLEQVPQRLGHHFQ